MKRLFASAVLLILLWISYAHSQESPKPAAFPPGVKVSDAAYPLAVEDKAKIRDLQYESDQLEIQNQKLLLQIEQNKTRQATLMDQEKLVAFTFAQKHQINLDQFELDANQLKFVKKKSK